MQSAEDRRRLLRAMYAEPVRAWLVLARCAAGLAVIALLAVIGAKHGISLGATAHVAVAAAPRAGQAAQVHRKQVFDERRARFGGSAGRHRIAGEAVERADLLPLALR